jgi:hypothetical protein
MNGEASADASPDEILLRREKFIMKQVGKGKPAAKTAPGPPPKVCNLE